MMTLHTKGPFRDANGRFRRKTREDMNDYERIMHDAMHRLALSEFARLSGPNSLFNNLMAAPKIGRAIRIRLPSEFKVTDRIKLID